MNIKKQSKLTIGIITILGLSLIIFLIYTKFYYGVITNESLLSHFVVCFNILISLISNLFKIIVTATLTEGNVKIVIISSVLVYLVSKVDISNLLLSITKFEVGQLKFECDIAKLKELTREEEENYKKLITNVESNDDENSGAVQEIKESEKRLKIIRLLISDPFLLKILISFIEGKSKRKTIPLNVLKDNTTIDSVKLIFDYEFSHNYIKITGIKKEVEDVVIKLYIEEFSNK